MTTQVLVADDDLAIVQLVSYILRQAGYAVCTALRGDEALTLLEQYPDTRLVISDIDMPGMDGLTLLAKLRARGGPPLLIITARGLTREEEQAIAPGAAGLLTKPFSRSDLMNASAPLLTGYHHPHGVV